MSQFDLYRKEIYNFMKSLTIKFDRLAVLRNNELQYSYEIDYDDKSTWAYYKNLVGEYHESNEMMQITSVDTNEVIDFTKENLLLHTRTAALYKPGSSFYEALEVRYPDNIDLIRSIVYPVPSIETAIEADDFTLLQFDNSFLALNERTNLVEHTQNFLSFNSRRWYISELEYEELYPIAFWAILWYNLSLSLFSKRLKNIKTPYVHPFHIWEYLSSKGLGKSRSILTNEQSLFLYRNIDYILKNKGKESTLLTLSDNLLRTLRVSIVGKKVYHNLVEANQNCIWNPEILSDEIVDYSISKPTINTTEIESISNINSRINEANLDDRNDLTHLANTTETLSYTSSTILPTKLIELKKYNIDNKYENVLIKFALDSLIQRLILDKVNYNTSFIDETTGIEIKDLPIKDVLLLIYYTQFRSRGETPVNIPTKYYAATGYESLTRPTNLSTTFKFDSHLYKISDHINVVSMLDKIRYDNSLLNQEEFVDLVADQFGALISHILLIRHSSNMLVHKSISTIYNELVPKRELTLNLTSEPDFNTWIDSIPNLRDLIDYYESVQNVSEEYDVLGTQLFNRILPFTNNKFYKYLSSSDNENLYMYEGLKNVFVQLCSYNITFLDTNRDSAMYFFLSNIPVDFNTKDTEKLLEDLYLNPLYEDMNIPSTLREPLDAEYEPVILDILSDTTTDTLLIDMEYDYDIKETERSNIDLLKHQNKIKITQESQLEVSLIDITCDTYISILGEE